MKKAPTIATITPAPAPMPAAMAVMLMPCSSFVLLFVDVVTDSDGVGTLTATLDADCAADSVWATKIVAESVEALERVIAEVLVVTVIEMVAEGVVRLMEV